MQNIVNGGGRLASGGQVTEQTQLYSMVLKNGNFEGALAADAAHEIIHATDKVNINLQFQKRTNKAIDVEQRPEAAEKQSLRNSVVKQAMPGLDNMLQSIRLK